MDEIAKLVITEEYINRFNAELTKLGATKIQVEIESKPNKGTVRHYLNIVGAGTNNKPIEIFSEGEMRIISLAAFIADVTGGNNHNPFIFDDPISSLDQRYEDRVVDRLAELSKSRQVIVFTHRLSLLGQLYEADKKLKSVGIRKEEWGTGEVGDIPLSAKKVVGALNTLKDEKIQRVIKIQKDSTYEHYEPYVKAICTDLRILIERIVTETLLGDIVQRHRKMIYTGSVKSLRKINSEDCDLIDGFMTKYSNDMHSQSQEAPRELPDIEEIRADIEQIIDWHKKFEKRAIPS